MTSSFVLRLYYDNLMELFLQLVFLALFASVPSRRVPRNKLTATIAIPSVTAGGLLRSILLATFEDYYCFGYYYFFLYILARIY